MMKTKKTASNTRIPRKLILSACALLTISACASNGKIVDLSNPFIPQPEKSGATVSGDPQFVDRGQYRAIVARGGEPLATLASQSGVAVQALAGFNGLPENYVAKKGEEFAIPTSADVPNSPYGGNDLTAFGGDATGSISATGLGQVGTGTASVATTQHTVRDGETAYSIARLYNTSVAQLSLINTLPADLSVTPGEVINVPRSDASTSTSTTATATTTTSTPTTTPPATSSAGGAFREPVSGTITQPYRAGSNDGITYSTAPKAEVRASAAGKVVLTSDTAGSQGTIVMVQHDNGLISVYGKLGDAKVSKGDTVSAGQVVGTTEAGELLFQLRRGTASVNPVDYF